MAAAASPLETRPAARARTENVARGLAHLDALRRRRQRLPVRHPAHVHLAIRPRDDLGLQGAAARQSIVHEERVCRHVGRIERHAVALEPVDRRQGGKARGTTGPGTHGQHHHVGAEKLAIHHHALGGAARHRHALDPAHAELATSGESGVEQRAREASRMHLRRGLE